MGVIICLVSVSYSPPATRPGYTPQMFNKALKKKKKKIPFTECLCRPAALVLSCLIFMAGLSNKYSRSGNIGEERKARRHGSLLSDGVKTGIQDV